MMMRSGQVPMGYVFKPTDQELIVHYLLNKVFSTPRPSNAIKDIDEGEFYKIPPNKLERDLHGSKEVFFFIHRNGGADYKRSEIRIVGNDEGYWKSEVVETLNHELKEGGYIVAMKTSFAYYERVQPEGEKKDWVMAEYELQNQTTDNGILAVRIWNKMDYKEDEWVSHGEDEEYTTSDYEYYCKQQAVYYDRSWAGIETYCGYVSRVSRETDVKYARYRAACDNALYGIGVAIEDIRTLRFSNSTENLNQELRGQLPAAHARVRELFAHINSLVPMDMQKEIYMGEWPSLKDFNKR